MFIEPGKATFANWSLSNDVCVSPPIAFASAVPLSSDLGCGSRTVVILKLLHTSAFYLYRLIPLKNHWHKLTIYLSLHAERKLLWALIAANDKGTDADPFGRCCPAPCPHPFDQQGADLPLHPWLDLPLTLINLIMLARGRWWKSVQTRAGANERTWCASRVTCGAAVLMLLHLQMILYNRNGHA